MDSSSEENIKTMDDGDVDFFDWEQIVHEAEENGEDEDSDSSFDMEGVEEIPTDDELEYDSDEDASCASTNWIEMKPKGYKISDVPPPNELSEDSKALLFWRDDGDEKSFSDWRIKVEVEKTDDYSEEKVTIYNVHRFALARGPKQSGYFKALLESDSFSENSDCTSTVKLPEEIAAHFPDFLDYLYAQPLESKFIIKFENWKSMKFLANYFLVPRLTEEVAEFIEKDMEYFNLDHMENYVSEFHCDISDDMSRRILPKAVCVCAEMIQSIEVDSPLLMSIPPAMFRKIIRRLHYDDNNDEQRWQKYVRVCSLAAAYLEHNVEDILFFSIYFCDVMPIWPWFSGFPDHKSDDSVIELALTWFRLMKQKGWNDDDDNDRCQCWIDSRKREFGYIISEYLHSKTPSSEMMERIVRDAPNDVVARCFKESMDEAGLAAKNIKFVESEAHCTRADAIKALKENDSDAAEAIKSITAQRQRRRGIPMARRSGSV